MKKVTNREKIILMTKLAVYDKHLGKHDKKLAKYFRHDYIYIRNMWTRFYVLIGVFVLLLLYWLHKIYTVGIDFLLVDINKHLTVTGIILVSVVVFYTAIGTIRGTSEYERARKRLSKYYDYLERLNVKKASDDTNEGAFADGTSVNIKRRGSKIL